jgi:hypothetical protein
MLVGRRDSRSAAATARAALPESRNPQRIDGTSSAPANLATELAERLGCAVLAMRYPVIDDFAIELSESCTT